MSADPRDLTGKVALITGAASGMGAAEARLFAARGATVAVTDIDGAAAESVAADIGSAAVAIRLDVASSESWAGAVQRIIDLFGRLDVLVNNAGVWRKARLEEWEPDQIESMIAVNLIGPILGIKTVSPFMSPGSSIVNVASTAGLRGLSGAVVYSASKFGLRGASRSAAKELGPQGIRVNCVFPGVVDTPMNLSLSSIDVSGQPIARAGRPSEVAEVVAFLASDASSFTTGAEVTADGGLTS